MVKWTWPDNMAEDPISCGAKRLCSILGVPEPIRALKSQIDRRIQSIIDNRSCQPFCLFLPIQALVPPDRIDLPLPRLPSLAWRADAGSLTRAAGWL